MRRLGIVAVGLALVVGIIFSSMVGNPYGASAQFTDPQPPRTVAPDQGQKRVTLLDGASGEVGAASPRQKDGS